MWKRLANPGRVSRVWCGDALDQPICASFEMLGEPVECGDTEGIQPALDAADGLGVNADQFSETFLRQICPQTGVGHVASDDPQESFVRHAISWSV